MRYYISKVIVRDTLDNKDIEIDSPCFEVEDSQPGYKGYKEGPYVYLVLANGERIKLEA